MGASIADILSNKEKSQLVLPNINKGDVGEAHVILYCFARLMLVFASCLRLSDFLTPEKGLSSEERKP
jgi:hypothetical protein